MADLWWCTFCGSDHPPDEGTLIDARYALGRCHGGPRQLIRDEAQAVHLANTVGKYRPAGVAMGGKSTRTTRPTTPEETRRIQAEGQP